jgi:hypothetical protein
MTTDHMIMALLGLLGTVAIGLSGWMFKEYVSLGRKVAGLTARVEAQSGETMRRFASITEWMKEISTKLDRLLMKEGP